jgi:beta-lactamase regulating signal transducer with metallopeptidase domain
MYTIFSLSDAGLTQFAVNVVVKATMLLLLALGIDLVVRRASAALRHRIWALLFMGLPALPALEWLTPAWTWRVLPSAWPVAENSTPKATTLSQFEPPEPALAIRRQPGTIQSTAVFDTGQTAAMNRDEVAEANATPSGTANAAQRPVDSVGAPVISRRLGSPADWWFMIWLLGVLVALAPLVLGLVANWRLRGRCRPLDDRRLVRRIDRLRRQLGLHRCASVLLGEPQQMPITFGLRRPCVVLPSAALDWPSQRFDAVVLHELAHIKRLDVPLQLMARAACAAYWFHPLVWWSIRRMRVARELACDDCVLDAGQEATDYAANLLEIAREHRTRLMYLGAALSMARRSQLEGRLLAVLDADNRRKPLGRAPAAILLAASLAIVAMLGAVRPASEAQERAAASSQPSPPNDESPVDSQRELALSGMVLSPEGKPAAGAEVEVIAQDHEYGWTRSLPRDREPERYQVRTDDSGAFQLTIPRNVSRPRRRLNVIASADGAWPAIESLDDRVPRQRLELKLLEPKEFRVQLIDPVGNPIANVEPRLQYVVLDGDRYIGTRLTEYDASASWPRLSRSDADGYCAAKLPASTKKVSLAIDDPKAGAHALQLDVGDEPVSAVLKPASVLNGKVVAADSGRPIAGAEVMVMEEPYRTVRTYAEGAFRVARGSTINTLFPAGQSIIQVYPPPESDYLFQAIEWEWPDAGFGDAELAVKLARGIPLEGVVVERGSGMPVVDARFCFAPQEYNNPQFKDGSRSRFSGADMKYTSDSQGHFRMPVWPGPGYLLVQAPTLDYVHVQITMGDRFYGKSGLQREYYDGAVRLDLKPGERPEPIKIVLQRGTTYRRPVVRPDGTPATGKAFAFSYLKDRNDVNSWLPEIPIADGILEVPGFDPALSTPMFVIDVEHHCAATVSRAEGHVDPESEVIQLQPCGAAKFRFVTDKGEPLTDYQPQLHVIFQPGAPATHQIEPDQPLWSDTIIWDNVARPLNIPKTDKNGRVVVEDLIPGASYNVYFVGKEGSWDEDYEFKVESDKTTDVGEVTIPEHE